MFHKTEWFQCCCGPLMSSLHIVLLYMTSGRADLWMLGVHGLLVFVSHCVNRRYGCFLDVVKFVSEVFTVIVNQVLLQWRPVLFVQ